MDLIHFSFKRKAYCQQYLLEENPLTVPPLVKPSDILTTALKDVNCPHCIRKRVLDLIKSPRKKKRTSKVTAKSTKGTGKCWKKRSSVK